MLHSFLTGIFNPRVGLGSLAQLQALLRRHNLRSRLAMDRPAAVLIHDVVYYCVFDAEDAAGHVAAFLRAREHGQLTPRTAWHWRFVLRIEWCVITRSGWVPLV